MSDMTLNPLSLLLGARETATSLATRVLGESKAGVICEFGDLKGGSQNVTLGMVLVVMPTTEYSHERVSSAVNTLARSLGMDGSALEIRLDPIPPEARPRA